MTQSLDTMPSVAGETPFVLRLPPELKERLAEWAKRDRRSLNSLILVTLERALAERDRQRKQRRQDERHV